MTTNPPKRQEQPPQAPQQDRAVLQWLLDSGSDPAIRWQVLRDLTGASPEDLAAERARVATAGWGARLLALQGTDGAWGGAAWNQEWDSTMHVLTLLREMGLDPGSAEARRAVGRVRERVRWMGWDWDGTWRGEDFVGNPFFAGEVEPCINGQVAASGAYFGLVEDIQRIIGRLLAEQLPDGGWNCEAERGSTRSSFHTTICVLEALLEYERAGGPRSAAVREARLRGEEYLLERHLLRRKSTSEVIDPAFTLFSFPTWWHYDVLRALDYLRSASMAVSTCACESGVASAASTSSMLTGSRRMASHNNTVCSSAERRANCSSSSARTLLKTTSPCSRNGAISPPKRSTMVSATILSASGLPA